MENVEHIFELLDTIERTYLNELLPTDIRPDVLDILEEDLIVDLQRILEKIKYYSQKVTNK